jgi:nascent polypeptide-associated complex subunit alpha
MFGGIDPKKMQAMMKQMGIKQEDIASTRVIIEREDGNIVIENPHVVKIVMQGQESWQITGEAREEAAGISEEDVKIVMEKANVSHDKAKKALEVSEGDIAQAIIDLS